MPEQSIFSINETDTLKEKALFINQKKIPFDKSVAALKDIAAKGVLTFRGKRLVVDLYSKASFSYSVMAKGNEYTLSACLKIRNQEFALESLDLLILGKPSWFIKGIQLFVIDETIVPSMLSPKTLMHDELLELIAEAKEEGIEIKGLEGLQLKQVEPYPCLKLKDRSGAFADLWMSYDEIEYKFLENPSGNYPSEKQWEQDLLETDFIKKTIGSTAYYCPVDKVTKAISFLLEIGWKILDCSGKKVVRETHHSLSADFQNNSLLLKGSVHYENFQADIKNVAGAFIKKERFLDLDAFTVGLINDNPTYASFIEEGEIVKEGLSLSRFTLKELFDKPNVEYSLNLTNLKNKLFEPPKTISIQGSLRPYQAKGVEWIYHLYQLKLGAILADDMGLGKTIQVLAFLSQLEINLCHVIVMPTSLLFNWQMEIKKFLPQINCTIHHGPNRLSELPSSGLILTSYATLRNDFLLFKVHPIECLVVDEAQVIKNQETKIAQTLCQLPCQFRLSLTGTPVENKLEELYSQFQFLMPGFLNDYDRMLHTACNLFLKKLQKKVKPFILRRKKEEVLEDLPAKIEQIVYVEMSPSQREAYDSYLSAFKKNILSKITLDGAGKHRIAIFEALLRLRQICCHPMLVFPEHSTCGKMDVFMEDIASLLAEGRKALVFSQFTSMLDLIAKELSLKNISFVRLDGNTKDRQKAVQDFQNSENIPLFLISLKAGGTGLNLTNADHVLIYDPWWNEAVEEQAISRAHRIGQKNTVIAKRYVTIESIEEKMIKLKGAKNKLIADLFTDDFSNFQFSDDDFLALFE